MEDIVLKYLSGEKLDSRELALFKEWYENEENRQHYAELRQLRGALLGKVMEEKWKKEQTWLQVTSPRRKIGGWWQYAAVILLLAGIGGTVWWENRQMDLPVMVQQKVEPGKNQAILMLSDGSQIALTDSMQQLQVRETGVEIRNTEGNKLTYSQVDSLAVPVHNTVLVPRGGEYSLILADGTKVLLNSESRLVYPVAFNGKSREVELEGEAFFEVATNPEMPFRVKTRAFGVTVTGTRFNVRVYPHEAEAATLVEGRVEVTRGEEKYALMPGQQSVVQNGKIKIRDVDVEEVTAWCQNTFRFREIRLENLLDELSRWYDVDVFYQNSQVKDFHFSAGFRRDLPIQEVIALLEKTRKVKFSLIGNTLTVKEYREK